MALTIVWSRRASLKIDQIISYLIAEWGEKSAKDFFIKVFEFLETLSEFPEIGSLENPSLLFVRSGLLKVSIIF